MERLKRVLVAVDFSACSAAALAQADRIAAWHNATLTALNAVPVPVYAVDPQPFFPLVMPDMEIALAESRRETAVALKVGNPDAERDFTDVRDTARAIASLASGRISGTFNVCSGRETSLYELVWLLGLTSNLEVSVAGKPDHHRRADVSRIVGSPAKLEAATGWKAETPLHSSLALLLDDWRTNRISPHDD